MEVKCHAHHIKGTYHQHDISLMLAMVTWLKIVWSVFSTAELFFLSSSILYSLEGSHYTQPALKDWGVMECLLKGEIST